MREEILNYNGTEIFYSKSGEGEALVLLHGFLHDSTMWLDFMHIWNSNYCVISIDLPGHGKSGVVKDISIDEMAIIVDKILQKEQIEKANFIGHSMGGYVGLAYADLFPMKVHRLILLHSSAYEDTILVKEKRDLSLKILEKHPAMFVRKTIEFLYTKENLIVLKKSIENSILSAKKGGYEGYKEATKAMRNRPSRISVLDSETNIFIVAGIFDKVIEEIVSETQMKLLKKGRGVFLKDVAHMGFLEDEKNCFKELNNYLGTVK